MTSSPIIWFIILMLLLVASAVLLWRRPRLKRHLLAFWALVIVALCFAPGLYLVAWHLRHGNGIHYRGRWIPIPGRWIADAEPQGATLTKLPISILFANRDPDSIMMGPLLPKGSDPEKNRKAWEKVFRVTQTGPAAIVPAPQEIDAPQGKIYCLPPLGKIADETSVVSCLMFQNTWVAQFFGNTKDADEFVSIIRSIR